MSSPLNKYARGHCVFNWILDRLFWVQESPQWFTRASLVIWFTCVVLAYRGHTGTLKLNKLINSPEQNQFGDQVSFHKNYRLKRSSSWFRTFPDTTDVQRQTSWQGFAFSIGQICSKLCYLIIKGKSALGVKHFNIRRLNRMRRWSDWGSSIVWCKLVACSAMSSVTSSQTFIKNLVAGKIIHALKKFFSWISKGSSKFRAGELILAKTWDKMKLAEL